MRFILFISLYLAVACTAGASAFSWVIRSGHSLELRHGRSETVLRFQVDPQPADPHFDILKTVGGQNLLWVGPEDHPWHYGHWFSWKFINQVNFWETNRKTGKSEGLTEVSEPEIQIQGDNARIAYSRYYRINPEEEPVLRDDFTIAIFAPPGDDRSLGPVIDWSVRTEALSQVTLDRTPLPGEPGGKSYGGYGGLSWRGAKALEQVRFSDSEGREGMEIHRQRALWVNATGRLGGKPAGIAIIAQKDRSEKQSSWYLASNDDLPFWYINPALLQPEPITLERGASFTHHYRVIAHDGSWAPDAK